MQFGVTAALIGHYRRHDEPHPDDDTVEAPWFTLEHRLTMVPGESWLPLPPIK